MSVPEGHKNHKKAACQKLESCSSLQWSHPGRENVTGEWAEPAGFSLLPVSRILPLPLTYQSQPGGAALTRELLGNQLCPGRGSGRRRGRVDLGAKRPATRHPFLSFHSLRKEKPCCFVENSFVSLLKCVTKKSDRLPVSTALFSRPVEFQGGCTKGLFRALGEFMDAVPYFRIYRLLGFINQRCVLRVGESANSKLICRSLSV